MPQITLTKKPVASWKSTDEFACLVLSKLANQLCFLDKSGNILVINQAWLDFEHERHGKTQEFEIGRNYPELLDKGLAFNRGGTAFTEGIRSVLNGTKSGFSLEYSMHISSLEQWFIGKVVSFPEHDPGFVLITHENISEYKRLEKQFRQAVESAPNAIVLVNESGSILMVNVQTETCFGYPRTELIGQPVELLVPERLRSAHIGFRQAYLASPVSRPMGAGRDLYGLRKDGTEFPIEIGLGLINDENGIIVLSSIIDITERKHASDKLKEALYEKEMLLKEVYHRVKNNLQVVSSLIGLQAKNVKHDLTAAMLKQSADRIKAMALLHEKLYQSKDLARIDFNEYIRSLVEHLQFGYGASPGKITITMKVDNVFLDVDTAIPCGLIINELISNALIHAFPNDRSGEISISFRQEQNEIILIIADNGIGFPANLDFKKTSSLGLQLVVTLTDQLMGRMSLDQSNWTMFTLQFLRPTKQEG
jgi:PAS domain S-box-containing protein